MSDHDNSPISARTARQLFAGLRAAPALVLAVSGGPDSVALMWLAARWRRSLARGPELTVVTVDHGLRKEAAREAREVKRLATELGLAHRTLRWRGAKPKAGLPAAAREARYRLLAQAARAAGASHVLTAHTRDDQAETVLMRLCRGSGIAGLSAMARLTARDGLVLARPLLDVPKSQLIATLKRAGIGFAEDPTNGDMAFTRPRLRALLPQLAAEGGDARTLVRLSARLARANAAVEVLTDGAERFLALRDRGRQKQPGVRNFEAKTSFEAEAFAALPEEVRLRLLLRAIDALGHEGPAELGKVETMLAALDQAMGAGRHAPANGRAILKQDLFKQTLLKQTLFKQTLAGALISLAGGRIHIAPAPARRSRNGSKSGPKSGPKSGSKSGSKSGPAGR